MSKLNQINTLSKMFNFHSFVLIYPLNIKFMSRCELRHSFTIGTKYLANSSTCPIKGKGNMSYSLTAKTSFNKQPKSFNSVIKLDRITGLSRVH